MSGSPPQTPGVIAPAPLIYLPTVAIGIGLDVLWPVSLFPNVIRYTLGSVFLFVSIAIMPFVLREFRRAGTSFDATKPSATIVTTGPFRFSRNPSYLSLTLLCVGIAVLTDNVWIIGLLLPALVLLHYGVIRREERYLDATFGDEYRRYRAKVRRWL